VSIQSSTTDGLEIGQRDQTLGLVRSILDIGIG
jgi:hypothetical protein